MNKKKILTLLITTSLLAVVGVGSTLAYFTDKTETLTNVVTMGNVDGVLVENKAEKKDGKWNLKDNILSNQEVMYENIMPGDTVKKNPTVCLKPGSADAWVRMTLDIMNDDDDNDDDWLDETVEIEYKEWTPRGYQVKKKNITYKKLILEEIEKDKNLSTKWAKEKDKDNVYYYKSKLTALTDAEFQGNYIKNLNYLKKATLFEEFEFPSFLDNKVASKSFRIVLNAELIQADHIQFLNDWSHQAGWYDENGNKINADIEPFPLEVTEPSATVN